MGGRREILEKETPGGVAGMISHPQPDPVIGSKKRLWETASLGLCPPLGRGRAGEGRARQLRAGHPGWAPPRTAARGVGGDGLPARPAV